VAVIGLGAAAAALPAFSAAQAAGPAPVRTHHVLLISVDGLHESDLAGFVSTHPNSALASLVRAGVDYTGAQTPVPSDSFPGMVAQVTGGNPSSTGVLYDDTFNHGLLPAGTTSCAGVAHGAEVGYTEALDLDQNSLDAGQGLSGLPGTILEMTGQPRTLINPANLPVDPVTCTPVYPDQYLKVNTVFTIIHDAGMRTAWSDKHPAYEILGGPGGTGIDDLFTPEINSQAIGFPAGEDWTSDNAATMEYDNFKVQAVLNEINGLDHSGKHRVGTPAIFGMNFQTVSTAEKLPSSDGLTGGYLPGGVTPGPLLQRALAFINADVGTMMAAVNARGLSNSTTIILSAKHGQSPTDPLALTRIPDSPIISGLDTAWAATHPKNPSLVAFATDDDIMQLWLSDHSQAACDFARQYLLTHSATGNDILGNPRTLAASGLTTVYAGITAAKFLGVSVTSTRHPDVIGIVQHGVVYTGGMSKIAEHGGADPQDRDVALVVAGAGVNAPSVQSGPVETTQIAPTILRLLGLDPNLLEAVQIEHTRALPGI
jgi:hypothetical protein